MSLDTVECTFSLTDFQGGTPTDFFHSSCCFIRFPPLASCLPQALGLRSTIFLRRPVPRPHHSLLPGHIFARCRLVGLVLAGTVLVGSGAWANPAPLVHPGALANSTPSAQEAVAIPPEAYRWPLEQVQIHRDYQPPQTLFGPGHRGIDIYAQSGQQVTSPQAGMVSFAGLVAGRPLVVVQHFDGLRSTLEPVSPTVKLGQEVYAGQVIGNLVQDASHCAPRSCLHWGVRRAEEYLDPKGLLGNLLRVRLLPLQ